MRIVLLFSVFIHFTSFGQNKEGWNALPQVSGTKAFVNQHAAVIAEHIEKEKVVKLEESYTGEKLAFVTKILPQQLENFTFSSHDYFWDQKVDLANGMSFKDISTSNIRYLDVAHGLPGNGVSSVVEGDQGLIYIGTSDGLVMYNGSEIQISRGLPIFPLREINSLFYDSKDRLWVGTAQGICYLYAGKLYIPNEPVFGPTHLKGFNENQSSGELLIFTIYNGVFLLNDNGVCQYKAGLPTPHVSSAIRAVDDKLWLAFGNSGMGYIENDSLYMYRRSGVFNTARSLLEVDGEIWIGVFVGRLLKHRNDSLFYMNFDNQDHRIYSIEKNKKGIWFADYGKGVGLIKKNNEVVFFDQTTGLVNTSAYSLLIDSFDNVWVADPAKGLSRIDQNLFHQSDKIIHKKSMTDLEIDQQGTWYIGEKSYIIKETTENYLVYGNGGKYCVDGLVKEDELWLANANHGLTRLKDEVFTFYSMKKNVSLDSTIYSIQMDASGGIWGWTYGNKLYCFQDEYFYNYSENMPWSDFDFVNVTKTIGNTIFALTKKNGVIAIADGKYFHFTKETGLASNQISHVYEDPDGAFWFCGNGYIQILSKQGGNTFHPVDLTQNQPILDLIEYKKDEYLAVTQGGILSIKTHNDQFEFKLYDAGYGLRLRGNSIIKKDAEGKILIGGKNNIMAFDPYFESSQRLAPKLSLNSIIIGDSLLQNTMNFDVSQLAPFSLQFNNIYWGGTSDLYYRIEEGNENNAWVESESNKILFNELPYGQYQLSVYAIGDERKSNQIELTINVLPYWYQSNWAKVLFFGLAMLLMIAIALYRERMVRIEKRRLEKLIDEKTELLQTEKMEVLNQLSQKEILMQEVHHRVKNNLTFLKSLLFLRASATDDENTRMILDECQARIHSMALVHQNLYDVEDASKVNFNVFLKELFFELGIMFDKGQGEVSTTLQTNNIEVEMSLSVFLGLILNEMITNSYKYAFTNQPLGKIEIALDKTNDGYQMKYADNGRGLSDDFDIKNSSGFGFKLIRILLSQINAEISYQKNEMNTFTILIPGEK